MTTNKQLRELARKATVGPWWIDSHGHRMSANGGLDTVFIADDRMGPAARHPETGNLSHWPNDWDASYIAAANPERVLALLDEIEALQADRDQQYDMKVKAREQRDAVTAKLNALQAECEKLRKDAEGMGQLLAECRAHLKPYHDSFMRAEAWEEGRYKSADALYRKFDAAIQENNS